MTIPKNIGVVLVALIAAFVLIIAVQQLNMLLYPLPDWVDTENSEHLTKLIPLTPLPALLMLELSYFVGSLGAGILIAIFVKRGRLIYVLIVGGLLTIAGFFNLASVPHPLWLAIVTSLTYLPVAYLGSRFRKEG